MRKQLLYGMGICVSLFVCGLIVAAIGHEYIIIRTSSKSLVHSAAVFQGERTSITCYFVQSGSLKSEKIELLLMPDWLINTQRICNAWLHVLHDEAVLNDPVAVTHVAAGESIDCAYISFDRPPFDKQGPVITRIHILKSLLKTLHDAGVPYKRVYFHVNMQVMHDAHLDFSHSWPISDQIDS